MTDNKVFDNILSYKGNGPNKDYLVSPSTIQEFFKDGNKLIRIPDYQRPYSWTKKHVLDLLNDVKKLTENENSSWFFGPIFTVKQSSAVEYTELLDGQQRITTIQILLREISLFPYYGNANFASDPFFNNFLDAIEACKQCLTKSYGIGKKKAVFTTEESIKELFDSYIIGFDSINSTERYREQNEHFQIELRKAEGAGSKTAETIGNTIQVIQRFLKENYLDFSNSSISENLKALYNFVDCLLTRSWLIEIPMQNHHDSIQIFESINNRGKSLTLVDKLQYKSIIKISAEKLPILRNKWKSVYSGLISLESEGDIKSEDDFFKVFINSISGDDITKEEEFLQKFELLYLDQGDDKILQFVDEALEVIKFYSIMNNWVEDKGNDYVESFPIGEQSKVRALLHLLKRTLAVSDNCRFLLFYMVRKVNFTRSQNVNMANWIWGLIKYIFIEEVLENVKSNVLRVKIMDIIKNGTPLDNIEKVRNYEIQNNSFYKLIHNNDNSESKFVLYFYAYLKNHSVLYSFAPIQYKNSHLEHLAPKAWKAGWSDFVYQNNEVIEKIKTEIENYPGINGELFLKEIQSKETLELKDYTTAPNKQEDTLLEFIGNKWILHASSNISASNESFQQKKEKYYMKDSIIKIPSNDQFKTGILSFDSFSFEEIIRRSFEISNSISVNFNKNWNEV
ncbi:MAG: hypothetical protein RLZZ585_173 [Bacteroidota bacterium]|jgi:hypothetical protein